MKIKMCFHKSERDKESTLLQYFELTAQKESDQIGFSGLLGKREQGWGTPTWLLDR